jgi:hypothetical protein
MQQIEVVADTFAGWVKDVPHLPKEFTNWLAKNAWWLTLIGVVLGVMGMFTLLSLMTAGSLLIASLGAPALGGAVFIGSLITLILVGIAVVIEGLAISPLKIMKHQGWNLLFLAGLIQTVGSLIRGLFAIDIISIIATLIASAVGFYVLNEIRDHFAVGERKK